MSQQQYTFINDCRSNTSTVNCGVPQGSILGPLLFILYINDIYRALQFPETKIILFADDTALLLRHEDPVSLKQSAEKELNNVYKWFLVNRLSLSLNKSNCILFHGKNRNPMSQIKGLCIDTEVIPRVTHYKYIGLLLDERLTWDYHINHLCQQLTKYFTIFYNIRYFIDNRLIRVIYYAYIYSNIKYGIELYGSAKTSKLDKVQTLQNKLLKTIMNKPFTYSTDQLHKDLIILKINDIYKFTILQFVHKCVHSTQITKFNTYYKTSDVDHDYQTRTKHHLHTQRYRTELGKSTVHNQGATLWNSIPVEIKDIEIYDQFKNKLKDFILNQYDTN